MKRLAVLFGVLITAVVLALQITPIAPISTIFKRLDYLIYDLRFQWSTQHTRNDNNRHIVIVDVDEKSLSETSQWPWPRKTVAELIDKLFQSGAIIVALDIVFAEPERNPADIVIEQLQTNNAASDAVTNSLRENYVLLDGDTYLANTFSQHEVVTGYFLHGLSDITLGALPEPLPTESDALSRHSFIIDMPGYNADLPLLQSSALSGGFLTIFPDDDGNLRRVPLLLRHNDDVYTSLALEVTRQYLLIDRVTPQFQTVNDTANVEGLWLDNRWVPTDEQAQMLIPYRGRRGYFDYLSASDVLLDRVPDDYLTNALVFIGTSSLGLGDLRTTPVGTSFPGVEIQATITDALLNGDIPYSPDWAPGANAALIVAVGLLLSFCLPRFNALGISAISAASLVLLIGFNTYLWSYQYIHLPSAALIVLVVVLGVVNTVAGYYSESKQRQRVVDMFSQYVAPAHIEKLLSVDNAGQTFDGESKNMTVLFSDIRSFTKISEQLSATELKQLLNNFFTPMTEIIFDHQGTIDKYVGDMIMAFWGAPLDDNQQEQHAVTTALLMLKKVQELKQEFSIRKLPEINIGIGINTGMMNVGDMGSVYRRAYTVLGDAVNLGSRLESITKFYGVHCLVSENSRAKVRDVVFRCVDHVLVVGKEEPIKIFEPRYFSSEATHGRQQQEDSYQSARNCYLTRRWDEAATAFREHQGQFTDDEKICTIYLERIEQYRRNGVEDNWCGIFRHTTK